MTMLTYQEYAEIARLKHSIRKKLPLMTPTVRGVMEEALKPLEKTLDDYVRVGS